MNKPFKPVKAWAVASDGHLHGGPAPELFSTPILAKAASLYWDRIIGEKYTNVVPVLISPIPPKGRKAKTKK